MWRLILLILLALAAGVGAAMIYGGARWKRELTIYGRACSPPAPRLHRRRTTQARSNDYRRRSNATFEPR